MATTLRRSRSKYGRTRRQRRKQKRTRGGGFLDDLVKQFKPKSTEEKCKEAEQEAEKICSSGVEGDIEMTEMTEMTPIDQPPSDTSVDGNDAIAGPDSRDVEMSAEVMPQPPIQPSETSNPMSSNVSQPGTSQMGTSQMGTSQPGTSQSVMEQNSLTTIQPQPLPQPSAANVSGGAKKSRKNNKKRSQSRRKKLKSKKHKK
jgi:hypothetical protein